MKKTVLNLLLLPFLVSCASISTIDKTTVDNVELNRYIGKWYEIARFENKFQKDMDGVTAEYSLNANGKIKVVNSGYIGSPENARSVTGKAKRVDKRQTGKLKVSFFLWFYSDYLILELDKENYSYALVAGGSDEYLWILSRTPQLEKETLNGILKKAKLRGYDINKLRYCKH